MGTRGARRRLHHGPLSQARARVFCTAAMPDDIRSFFGGAPKKPAEVKPDPPAPDAMAIDLTDDKPPSSGEKRKAPEEAVDLTEETPAAKKPKVPETKKTPTKKTPTPKKTPTKKTPTK